MYNLREAYKEIYQSQVNEAHYNPATGKIQAKKPTREEIAKLAKAAAASGKKKRKPVGSVRKNSATFKPSSPEKAKEDMRRWSSYWGGPKNEEKDPSYLEPDMKKRRKNNEKAIEDMENTQANKDMVAAVRKKFDEATKMAKLGYDEVDIRNKIADKTIKANTKAGRTVDKATALEDKPTYGNIEKKEIRQNHARAQRGTFHSTNSSNPGLHGNPYNANKEPSESDPNTPERVGELQDVRGKQRARVGMTPNERKLYTSYEYDRFDTILEYLISEGYADTQESALAIMENMSNAWLETIADEWKPVSKGAIDKLGGVGNSQTGDMLNQARYTTSKGGNKPTSTTLKKRQEAQTKEAGLPPHRGQLGGMSNEYSAALADAMRGNRSGPAAAAMTAGDQKPSPITSYYLKFMKRGMKK